MHSSLLSALSNPKFRCAAALIAVALVAAGCASRRPAPVEDRTAAQPPAIESVPQPAPPAASAPSAPVPTYTVKRGDTLAQIALDAGLDYRELASWNGIENPNVIRVGQMLVMAAPGSASSTAPAPGTAVTTPLAAAPPVAPKVAEPAAPQVTSVLPSGRNNTPT